AQSVKGALRTAEHFNARQIKRVDVRGDGVSGNAQRHLVDINSDSRVDGGILRQAAHLEHRLRGRAALDGYAWCEQHRIGRRSKTWFLNALPGDGGDRQRHVLKLLIALEGVDDNRLCAVARLLLRWSLLRFRRRARQGK